MFIFTSLLIPDLLNKVRRGTVTDLVYWISGSICFYHSFHDDYIKKHKKQHGHLPILHISAFTITVFILC